MDKNIELMKKIIEEKKKKGASTKNNNKIGHKSLGNTAKGKNSKKTGGLFDR